MTKSKTNNLQMLVEAPLRNKTSKALNISGEKNGKITLKGIDIIYLVGI